MGKKKEAQGKPKYGMFKTACFMIRLAWVSKEKKVLVMGLLSAIFAVLGNILGLYISPTLISMIQENAGASDIILTICAFTVLMMITSAVSSYISENEQFGRITVRCEIINMLNSKAATTSYPNLFNEEFRKLLEKSGDCTSGNDQATEDVWNTLTNLLKDVLGFVVYVLLLTNVQPLLFVIVILASTVSYFATKRANNFLYEKRTEIAEFSNQMYYTADRATRTSYAKDIRIFGLRPWLEELFEKAVNSYSAIIKKAETKVLVASVIDLVMAFLRNGAAYAFLITLVVRGEINASEFLLYFSAVSGFSAWVTGILGGVNRLHKQSIDISTVMECIEYPDAFNVDSGTPIPFTDTPCEIRLENVSFKYDGAEKYTLENIDLVLRPNEKIAVVGLNGAGKTTLIKILCGFMQPTSGRVLYDGKDLMELKHKDYYRLFSAVFQDFTLIPATIAANVAQTEENIDFEKVSICLEKAGLTQKVASLPDGVNTHLNRDVYEDAVLLSGGEEQRLMLARALYKNAPYVILDEPTAALDPIAEAELYNKYNEMTSNKSSIYISHRLASTRFCDRIILIDNAKIAEQGSHEELLKAGGKYAELFEVQSKYYREEAQNEKE